MISANRFTFLLIKHNLAEERRSIRSKLMPKCGVTGFLVYKSTKFISSVIIEIYSLFSLNLNTP